MRRATPVIRNKVSLLLCLIAALALLFGAFMNDAPNRLADGVALPIWRGPWPSAAVVAAILAALAGLAFVEGRASAALQLALGIGLVVVLLAAASLSAQVLTVPGHPAQRHALGAAFWIAAGAAGLTILDAMRRLAASLGVRAAILAAAAACFTVAVRAGCFEALSLAREFSSHRGLFLAALERHALLVVTGVLAASLLCAPLVILVRGRARGAVFAVLGIVQTIPSIALFGLLIAPLTALAEAVPPLRAAGLSGLGVAPALVALVLYAAFPLVRMTDAAFASVPADARAAAAGLGFSPRARFFAVDLPLALPVIVAGLRVVALQAIGLATVAALIGGGGLGTFIFQGIGEYALDLVLVGALPVIALALVTDFAFRLAAAAVAVPA